MRPHWWKVTRGRGPRVSAPHPQPRTAPPPHLHFVPFSPRQRSGPGPAGPDQSGPRGRCGCCPCCGLSSGPRSSAPRCEGAPASATPSTGTPVTPGSRAEPRRRRAGPARSRAGRAPHSRSVRGAACARPRAGAPLFEPAGEGEGRGEARPGLPPPARVGGRAEDPGSAGGWWDLGERGSWGGLGLRSEPRPLASGLSPADSPALLPEPGRAVWRGREGALLSAKSVVEAPACWASPLALAVS